MSKFNIKYDCQRIIYGFRVEYHTEWWHVDANDWDPCTQPVESSHSLLALL